MIIKYNHQLRHAKSHFCSALSFHASCVLHSPVIANPLNRMVMYRCRQAVAQLRYSAHSDLLQQLCSQPSRKIWQWMKGDDDNDGAPSVYLMLAPMIWIYVECAMHSHCVIHWAGRLVAESRCFWGACQIALRQWQRQQKRWQLFIILSSSDPSTNNCNKGCRPDERWTPARPSRRWKYASMKKMTMTTTTITFNKCCSVRYLKFMVCADHH